MNENTQLDNWKLPFFSIWTGQAFSLIGSQVVQFALVWWLTLETGSATVLATASLMALLPGIFIGPLAGAYVDRWNRRLVMIVADALVALATLWLAALFWAGAVEIWHVYLIMFLRSVGGSFHWPAMQASTSLMVPREQLGRVAGLNQTIYGLLNIAGPPLGALLMELLPLQSVVMVDVVTAALAITPLLFLSIPQPQRSAEADPAGTSIWSEVREGLRYVWAWPGLLVLIGAAMILKIALTPAFALIPLLVSEHFQGGAAQLSVMEASAGIGMLLGGLALSAWGGFPRKIYTILLGTGGLAAAWIVLSLTPPAWFPVGLGCLFIVGLAIPLVDGPVVAILQSSVEPEMQGRVLMLVGSLISITSPIGLAIAGPVSDWIGLQVWYLAAGLLGAALAVGGLFIPALINIEENVNGGSAATPASPEGAPA